MTETSFVDKYMIFFTEKYKKFFLYKKKSI